MFQFVVIGMIAVIITSLFLINSSIDDQQELAEINFMYNEKQSLIITESLNIKAVKNDSGGMEISNSSNEEIRIIQVRVYDDDGDFVQSFEIDEIIQGNTELLISDLPISLQELLLQ